MKRMKRQMEIIYCWLKLWWIVNIIKKEPSDFHRALTTLGYSWKQYSIDEGYIREYTRNNTVIRVTVRKGINV